MALLFPANGLILGRSGGALPSIRERVDISDAHVSVLLFAAARRLCRCCWPAWPWSVWASA